MNTVVWYSPRQALVSSKLWVVFNTLVCTGYGMHYAVLRNMWERKHWEAKMRLIAKTADISASHVNSKHIRSVSDGVGDEEAGECAKEVFPHHLESPQTGSGHDMAMQKLENEPLPTVQILWLLVSISFGASTYFIGQVWSWAYFKTTPHPLWLDLVLIYTLRLFIVGVTTIGTILLHAKLGPRHTIYAYTFFCDMIYWMLYRNVFTAAFSSTWTIILFGAINFVQRVAWVTFKTSRFYHDCMIWLSDWNTTGVLKVFFAAQHGVSDSASIMTRTASGSMSSLGLELLDGELAEFNNHTDENKANSAAREISEPNMDQEVGTVNSETNFSTLERAATTSNSNKRTHLRSTVAIKSITSINQVNDNTPNSRYSLPPLGEATEAWSYANYTKAQILFQAFNAAAQLITMVCFVVSISAIRHGPNAGAYPSLTILLDDSRYRRVMFETLSTFVSELLGSLVGFWLVHRMTGREVWQEWVKFVSRNPRTFVLTMMLAIHVLMDSAVMLVNLEFDP
ncbi:hypothetical protein SpCBS45565_g02179 [Spizellomyces sp. 'palustris']|nr:hypothetical protein SpCBS45565_g02179 [Spizellomyces sp. 'palustris']